MELILYALIGIDTQFCVMGPSHEVPFLYEFSP